MAKRKEKDEVRRNAKILMGKKWMMAIEWASNLPSDPFIKRNETEIKHKGWQSNENFVRLLGDQ
jgi:hypothetical protein